MKTMIALHLDAVIPNVFIQECFDDFLETLTGDVIKGFSKVEKGRITIPNKPGIGVSLDEEEAKKHPYGKSNFLRMFKSGWESRKGARD